MDNCLRCVGLGVGVSSELVSMGLQAAATESEAAAPSSSAFPYFSPRIQRLLERKREFENREVEFSIEAATSHFTELSVQDDGDAVKLNHEIFEALKNDPEVGVFFNRKPYELKIGRLIGRGGQAEVYEATETYLPGQKEELPVVKPFNKGFPLVSLKQLWPPGLMKQSFYEVLTGRVPFEEVPPNDFDVVLRGQRPTLPADIRRGTKNLIERCWHADPRKRPSFRTILKELQVICL